MAKKSVLADIKEVPEETIPVADIPPTAPTIPARTDSGWSDWVMLQFTDDELVVDPTRPGRRNPKTDGLRRVAALLLGPTLESRVLGVYEHFGRTVVHYQYAYIPFRSSQPLIYSDVADVHKDNTDALFLKYPVATAATRAEGRCLRKALGLNRVCAEEVGGGVLPSEDDMIEDNQIGVINNMCRQLDINVLKFIGRSENKYEAIEDVTRGSAEKMCGFLHELRRVKNDPAKFAQLFPSYESVKGYNPNWRKV